MKKSLFLSLLLLSGCSVAPEETPPCACDDYVPPYVKPPSASNQENIQQLLAYIAQKAKDRWGEDEFVEAGKHRYVKYLDGYNTRAHIDFEAGKNLRFDNFPIPANGKATKSDCTDTTHACRSSTCGVV